MIAECDSSNECVETEELKASLEAGPFDELTRSALQWGPITFLQSKSLGEKNSKSPSEDRTLPLVSHKYIESTKES